MDENTLVSNKDDVLGSTEKSPQEVPNVEDLAAHDYMTLLPRFDAKLEEMSNNQLKKVMSALMKYPFESTVIPRWSYPQEQELFNIGLKIQDTKFVLMKTVLEMKKDQIDRLMNEQPQGETNVQSV
jgi:hypothetical protein